MNKCTKCYDGYEMKENSQCLKKQTPPHHEKLYNDIIL